MPTGPPDSPFSPQERSDRFSPQESNEAGEGETEDWRVSYDLEPVAERIIRAAMEAGDFDDLPGTGEPIPGAGRGDDDLWWVRSWLERNRSREAQESATRE